MSARGVIGIGILAAWGAGIAVYAQRELSRSPREKLAEIAARVGPGATYFAVNRASQHVGFASNTIDTIPGGLQVTDYLVADLILDGTRQRATAQSVVRLSRALALRDFTITFGSAAHTSRTSGRLVGDSLLEYVVRDGSAVGGDTTRVRLAGPLLLPTLVPLVVALGDPPEVGRRYTFDTFDPTTMAVRSVPLAVRAESLFVLVDSAAFNPSAGRWLAAHADTVRGFHLVADSGTGGDGARTPGGIDAWVDEQGRMIDVRGAGGLSLRRTAYEVAFENWRKASPVPARRSTSDAERLLTTAVAAGVVPGPVLVDTLRLRVRPLDLSRFAAHGGSQTVQGDTVTIVRDRPPTLRPSFPLPPSDATRKRFASALRAEPLLEVDHPQIVALSQRLRARDAMADAVVTRIATWVHDSLAKEPMVTLPSAFGTLRFRRGDANEHAQLFVALARAAGVPARTVSGMLEIDGKFYYHAWAEVLLQRWVGVDPMFGQFPTDASHLRLLVGGLTMQAELARLIGRLDVEILSRSTVDDPSSTTPVSTTPVSTTPVSTTPVSTTPVSSTNVTGTNALHRP